MQAAPKSSCHFPAREGDGHDLMRARPDAPGIPVIVNAHAGGAGAADAGDSLLAAFQRQGLQARLMTLAQGQSIADTVDALLAEGAGCIVAAGGDGTINAVAARLLDCDVALGVLPLGTLNHFARDVGIASSIDDAVAVLAAGHCIACDVGEVNGRIFLNNSGIGMYPRIVAERERARRRLGAGKWPAMVRATWESLRHPCSSDVAVCIDGKTVHRQTPFVFVGNNAYEFEGFGLGRRRRLDAGALSLYILREKSTLGFLWMALRSLLGIGSHVDDFDAYDATQAQVRLRRHDVEVSTDGEVTSMASPLCYRIRPQALRVLAPAPAPTREDRS
jgi:YegS/Rv2252/BmrU family lipid kinase